MQVGPGYSCRNSRHNGFSLIELMVVVAIIAILASIALPSYSHYVSESRAKGASSDLVALSLVYENDFQKTLVYPAYASGTSIAALPSNRSGTQTTDFGAWSPAEGSYYNYTIYSTSSTYTVTATAVAGNCTLTLTAGNVRTATGNGCGFSSW